MDREAGVVRQSFRELCLEHPYGAKLLRALSGCNSSEIAEDDSVVNGNPTDAAVLRFVEHTAPGAVLQCRQASPRIAQVPFSSTTKVGGLGRDGM